jgi:hypothetical protein
MLDIATWANVIMRKAPILQQRASDVVAIVEVVMTVAKRILVRVTVSSDVREIVARTSGVGPRTLTAGHTDSPLEYFSFVNVGVELVH